MLYTWLKNVTIVLTHLLQEADTTIALRNEEIEKLKGELQISDLTYIVHEDI